VQNLWAAVVCELALVKDPFIVKDTLTAISSAFRPLSTILSVYG
jgi:hypothetical protein